MNRVFKGGIRENSLHHVSSQFTLAALSQGHIELDTRRVVESISSVVNALEERESSIHLCDMRANRRTRMTANNPHESQAQVSCLTFGIDRELQERRERREKRVATLDILTTSRKLSD